MLLHVKFVQRSEGRYSQAHQKTALAGSKLHTITQALRLLWSHATYDTRWQFLFSIEILPALKRPGLSRNLVSKELVMCIHGCLYVTLVQPFKIGDLTSSRP
jgi:hypothetical protein